MKEVKQKMTLLTRVCDKKQKKMIVEVKMNKEDEVNK